MIDADLAYRGSFELGEGPVWDSNRAALLWVDILAGTVHRWSPDTGATYELNVGQSVGAVAPGGTSAVGAAVADGFAALAPSGRVLTVNPFLRSQPDVRMNDGKTDPAGRLVAGTTSLSDSPGLAALYRLEDDGSVTLLRDGLSVSNGLAWSQDGAEMFHIDTPSRSIRGYEYDIDGGYLGEGRCVVSTADYPGLPDGMTIDADGNLWVAFWDGAVVRCFDPHGRLLEVVSLPVDRVTSCTFGGPDLRTLYITTARLGLSPEQLERQPLAGSIFSARPGVAGMPPVPWRGCQTYIDSDRPDFGFDGDVTRWYQDDTKSPAGNAGERQQRA